MSDIADCKYVSDNAVTVSVDCIRVCLDIVGNHLALQLGTLICVESYIVGVRVVVQSILVKLACGAVGRLTVEPCKRLVLVGYIAGRSRCLCLCGSRCSFGCRGISLRRCCGSARIGTAACSAKAENYCGCNR